MTDWELLNFIRAAGKSILKMSETEKKLGNFSILFCIIQSSLKWASQWSCLDCNSCKQNPKIPSFPLRFT